eukprot:tig00020693_g13035.t1
MELSLRFCPASVVRHAARVRRQQERARAAASADIDTHAALQRDRESAARGIQLQATRTTEPRALGGAAGASAVRGVIAILDITGAAPLQPSQPRSALDLTPPWLTSGRARGLARAGLCEKAATNDQLIEELCKIINGAFSKEIEVVEKYGGEVLCFLGDGLLVFWPDLGGGEGGGPETRGHAPPETGNRGATPVPGPGLGTQGPRSPPDLHMASRAAAAVLCALEIQEVFSEACTGMGASDLRLRVAVAAGEFQEYFCGIGGVTSAGGYAARGESALVDEGGRVVPGRMVHFIAGPAVEEAGAALGAIKTGEVAVCASAATHLLGSPLGPGPGTGPGSASGRDTPAGLEGVTAYTPGPSPSAKAIPSRKFSFRLDPLRPVAVPVPVMGPAHVVAPPSVRGPLERWAKQLPPAAAAPMDPGELGPDEQDAVALYVPYTVRARFRDMREWAALSGVREFDPTRFLSEFRVVSVLFMKLEGLDPSQASVQRAVQGLQAVLYSHEGSLRQIVLDDKGLVFIAVFGLWPFAHEDDAARAITCAVDMQASMRAMGVKTHVGITTGLVFCTFVGSARRSEFSVFGTVVNRAAHLMSKAEGGVFVDEKTCEACRARMWARTCI